MVKKRYRICDDEHEIQPCRSKGTSQASRSNEPPQLNRSKSTAQPSRTNQPSQVHRSKSTSQPSRTNELSQFNRSNGSSQPSRSNEPSQHNQSHGPSQLNRSNGSSQPSWSHPSSHAPSQAPQPQESEVNLQLEDPLSDEEWLLEDEMRSTDESIKRNTRGITRMADVWNLPPGQKIMLTFNEDLQIVCKEGGTFNRFLGTIARKPHLCPINQLNWHKVPDQYKEDCWSIIESKFAIPRDEQVRDIIKHRALKSIGEKWRNWKCSLKSKHFDETKTAAQIVATAPSTVNREHYADLVAYWFTTEGMEISTTNKSNRREQKSAHTAGSKTYAQHAYDMEHEDGIALDRAKLYIPLHKKKDGTPVNEEAAEKIEKLEDLMRSQPSNSEGNARGRISWSPNDIYSQVMGKERHGRVRGLGFGPTPSRHTGFMSNNNEGLRMVSNEEIMRDKETINELKDKLTHQEDHLQTQDAEIKTLKEQVAFLLRQVVEGSSGAPDQASPQTHQRSSFGSHDMQPSNRGCFSVVPPTMIMELSTRTQAHSIWESGFGMGDGILVEGFGFWQWVRYWSC